MIIGRLLGWYLFFAGFAVLVQDTLSWMDSLHWAPLTFGQFWYDLSPSLDLSPAVVQFYVWQPLWNDVIAKLLACWAFAVLMAVGMLCIRLCRDRRQIAPSPSRSLAVARPS